MESGVQDDHNQLISIMMPVYNGARYLAQTLDSALAQTLPEFEMLCIDDGSTDGSLEILQSYAKKDARIRVLQTPQNMGAAAKVLNFGLDHMRGRYFVYTSQDDFYSPDWLERMRERAIQTGADAVVPDLVYYHENHPEKILYLIGLFGDRSVELTNRQAVRHYWGDLHIPGNALWNAELIKRLRFADFSLNSDEYSVCVFYLHCNKVVFSRGQFFYRQDNPEAVTKKVSSKTFDYPYTQWKVYQLLIQNQFDMEQIQAAALLIVDQMRRLRHWLNHKGYLLNLQEREEAERKLAQCKALMKEDNMFRQVMHSLDHIEDGSMAKTDVHSIPIVAVSYNVPELIETLLHSLRRFYRNPIYIIDGSVDEVAPEIAAIVQRYDNARFIPFGYNIHHGPGIAWAVHNFDLSGPVLFLDSDVEVIKEGMIESLLSHLEPHLYGVGDISYPILGDSPPQYRGVPYLSPACMLCNVEVMRQWPMPIKHGAPMIVPMQALAQAGKSDLVRQVDWVKNDFSEGTTPMYFRHDWQGTVRRTGGYHYDAEPPSADYNHDLLALMPTHVYSVVEVGCGNGAFARAYKKANPVCHYVALDVDEMAVRYARKPCDLVLHADIETMDEAFWMRMRSVDVWVFSEVLEFLRDPWSVLQRIRTAMPAGACVLASFRNAQHWSVQARLNADVPAGVDAGLFERKQLHAFGRQSMLQMFQYAGFEVQQAVARVAADNGERYYPAIRQMAKVTGANPDHAVQDCVPVQYLLRAIPK